MREMANGFAVSHFVSSRQGDNPLAFTSDHDARI
jgi:hypothetical protein